MCKLFFCEDVLVCGCPAELQAATEEEVMTQAATHARSAHGVRYLDEQITEKVRAAIITR